MTAVPLGQGAYKRDYAGAPEVKLLNRWLEPNPANPREGTSILARPGTTVLNLNTPGTFIGATPMRGIFALNGLFNDDLFIVCGSNLYRMGSSLSPVQITGAALSGTGKPEVAWQQGAGYTRLWVADGGFLYYYNGNTNATWTITKTGAIVNGTDKISVSKISVPTTYYAWGTTFSSSDAGTSTNPYIVKSTGDPLMNLVKAINASGIPGVDYSGTLTTANTIVSAVEADSTHVVFTDKTTGISSASVTIAGGTAFSISGTASITGTLQSCLVPNGGAVQSVTQVAGYVLVSIAGSSVFYWVNPGDTSINALDFATKESSPDPIISMREVGDQVLIMGQKSTENWYATGDSNVPFAPIQGRVYARGVVDKTPVVVEDAVFVVGDDCRVYSVGFQAGDNTEATWGVTRISNNGIEERIRRQVRRERGLTP